MSVTPLGFSAPFFRVRHVVGEGEHEIGPKSIVLNLSPRPLGIRRQALGFFQSTVVANLAITEVARCLVIEGHDAYPDPEELFRRIRGSWTLAFEATGLERHRGVRLWRSPKERLGDVEVNFCLADAVPLNVGLHRTHWGEGPFREVHTQILGFGKMQQCAEEDLATLYREDGMAPGASHPPMYDEACSYPWHQYETITRGVFMATELRGGG